MGENKQNIIKKVLPLFIKNGYKAVSLNDILQEIALSRGTFYYYFISKAQCFEECVRYFMADAKMGLETAAPVSLREYLILAMGKVTERVKTYSAFDRLIFINDAIKIVPHFLEYYNSIAAEEVTAWTDVVKHAIESHEIKAILPAEQVAKLFIQQCDGLIVDLSARNSGKSLRDEIQASWDALYSLLTQ